MDSPYPVEQAVRCLGANLRAARLSCNLTIAEVADKIGTGPRAVSDAEKGKVSTGTVAYVALLRVYDLLEPMHDLADPAFDEEGLALSPSRERARARGSKELDSDF